MRLKILTFALLLFACSAHAQLTVPYGGTGVYTLTPYGILLGGTTYTGNVQQVTSLGTSGQVLTSNGVGAAPSWSTLTTAVGTSTDSTNSASGAITIGSAAFQYFNIQYNGVGSYTIAAPTYAQEGTTITIIDLAAHADTITCSTDGFNAKGSSGHIVLTGATIGDNVTIHASDQHWIVTGDINGTIN